MPVSPFGRSWSPERKYVAETKEQFEASRERLGGERGKEFQSQELFLQGQVGKCQHLGAKSSSWGKISQSFIEMAPASGRKVTSFCWSSETASLAGMT